MTEGQTEIVNSSELADAETGCAPTAWAEVVDYPPTGWDVPVQNGPSWLKLILGIVLPAAAVVVAIVVGLILTVFRPQLTAQPLTLEPTVLGPAAVPPTPEPAPRPEPTPDDRYISRLNSLLPGTTFVTDRDNALKQARKVCGYLSEGDDRDWTLSNMEAALRPQYSTAGAHGVAEAFVFSATAAYCPQFETPQTDDDAFIGILTADNADIAPHSIALSNAHIACQQLTAGVNRRKATDDMRAITANYSADQANTFMNLATNIYCPQFA